jgi:tetratricopeptide (TPR) repeat protein
MTKVRKQLGFGLLAAMVALSFNLAAMAEDAKDAAAAKAPAWQAQFEAGKLAAAKGESDKAKAELSAALKVAEAANDDQGIAEICNQLANIYLTEGDIVNASANAKRGKDAALKILMADPRTRPLAMQLAANEENGSVWISHMMKAQFAIDKNDGSAAENEYTAAVNKAREYASDGMPMASALAGLGRVLVQEGKYAEAESHLRRAIELCEKNWTPVTKSSALDAAEAMDHLATVLEKTGRKDEATKIASRSKEVRETKSLKPAKSAAQSAEGNAAK